MRSLGSRPCWTHACLQLSLNPDSKNHPLFERARFWRERARLTKRVGLRAPKSAKFGRKDDARTTKTQLKVSVSHGAIWRTHENASKSALAFAYKRARSIGSVTHLECNAPQRGYPNKNKKATNSRMQDISETSMNQEIRKWPVHFEKFGPVMLHSRFQSWYTENLTFFWKLILYNGF